ncbi:MAG TPA: hypothetical protein VIR54_05610 [Vicinamibacterales bacterium]
MPLTFGEDEYAYAIDRVRLDCDEENVFAGSNERGVALDRVNLDSAAVVEPSTSFAMADA